jgi:hypothetical protein
MATQEAERVGKEREKSVIVSYRVSLLEYPNHDSDCGPPFQEWKYQG